MDSIRKDFVFALRQLWRRPGFSIVAVLVLALGLGANTAIFSVVNAVLLQPLPFPDPAHLMAVFEVSIFEDNKYNVVSPGNYLDWRRDNHHFQELATYWPVSFNLSGRGESFTAQRVRSALCSSNLFRTLGVQPVMGRGLREEEDRPNAPYVAVISYGLWQTRFHGTPDVLSKKIRLDDINYDVIGVMPRGFSVPERDTQIWASFQRHSSMYGDLHAHGNHFLHVVGRLRANHTASDAQSELTSFISNYRHDHPADTIGPAATVMRFDRYLVRDFQTSLLVLLGAVGCLLLIACVNIANLLLARALSRQREMAIRAAVGAMRSQIIRQLLIESATVALLGAAVGILVASYGLSYLTAHVPAAAALPQAHLIGISLPVLCFTILLALVTGSLAGLAPALSASRADLVDNLKDGSRGTTGGRSQKRLRDWLVGVEVAVSLVLLIGAGLLIRSFAALQNIHTGVRTEHTLTMAISLPDATYHERAKISHFAQQLSERVQTIHGLSDVGVTSYPPLAGHWSDNLYHIEGHPLPPGRMMDLTNYSVDGNFFQAAGLRLLKGRTFTPRDNAGFDDKHLKLDAAIISESTARQFFGSLDPIGQRLQYGKDGVNLGANGNPPIIFQVIGVVSDTFAYIQDPIEPTIYLPIYDGTQNDLYLVLHSDMDDANIASAVRNEISRLDPELPVHDIRTINQIMAESTSQREFSLVLLSIFAGLALLLAAVGLYGVVSYNVSQRTPEIGIRMALGARGREVSRLILLAGMKPALLGILAGLMVAFFAANALRSMLFGISVNDPLTFVLIPLLMLLIVAVAILIPATRATRIDPTVALRAE